MSIKRYVAATTRDCLRTAKDELGADAIVISCNSVAGGIEIIAMAAASLDGIASRAAASEGKDWRRVAGSSSRMSEFFARIPDGKHAAGIPSRPVPLNKSIYAEAAFRDRQATVSPFGAQRYEPSIDGLVTIAPLTTAATVTDIRSFANSALSSTPDTSVKMAVRHEVRREMQDLRVVLQRQHAEGKWGELSRTSPVRACLMVELLEKGFSVVLARSLTAGLAHGIGMEDGRDHVVEMLDRRLRLFDADNDVVDAGGAYALVGPTGVGKTTTAAKLAARCAFRYGAEHVALVTNDGHRVGAREQLHIYARILGITVHVVSDGDQLRRRLTALANKHLILIDTVGMGPHDRMMDEQDTMLADDSITRLLLLDATSRGDMLDDVIGAFRGTGASACIVSKIDETGLLAPTIDAIIRNDLAIAYIANGQRVPQDLHVPNRKYLLHRAVRPVRVVAAHRLNDDEAGMMLAGIDLDGERRGQ